MGRGGVSDRVHERDMRGTMTPPISGKNGNHTEQDVRDEQQAEAGEREMACPVCGALMPDLKGGKASICAVCGFKDSCCY